MRPVSERQAWSQLGGESSVTAAEMYNEAALNAGVFQDLVSELLLVGDSHLFCSRTVGLDAAENCRNKQTGYNVFEP